MEPKRDLDSYGRHLFCGNVDAVMLDWVQRGNSRVGSAPDPAASAAEELYSLQWGPLKTRIYNVVLLGSIIGPLPREAYVDMTSALICMEVPVDGVDLAGTTALSHSISTWPAFDTEIATLLLNAGGDINHRNRYGSTAGHDICGVHVADTEKIKRATTALEWFMSHGGNIDIKDNDGMSARYLLNLNPRLRSLLPMVAKEDARRRSEPCCTFCGLSPSEKVKQMVCGRCKKATYCAKGKCQKADWPRHKTDCKA